MLITSADFLQQHKLHQQMPGGSVGDLCFGFMPAFKDFRTGETHLSVYPDGSYAMVHMLEGLPMEWVSEWDDQGRILALKETIVAGFMRDHRFYTLDDLYEFEADG
ncbi:MAG: hypothetical protein ACFCUJ_03945 [Thiotrichales bacterium]